MIGFEGNDAEALRNVRPARDIDFGDTILGDGSTAKKLDKEGDDSVDKEVALSPEEKVALRRELDILDEEYAQVVGNLSRDRIDQVVADQKIAHLEASIRQKEISLGLDSAEVKEIGREERDVWHQDTSDGEVVGEPSRFDSILTYLGRLDRRLGRRLKRRFREAVTILGWAQRRDTDEVSVIGAPAETYKLGGKPPKDPASAIDTRNIRGGEGLTLEELPRAVKGWGALDDAPRGNEPTGAGRDSVEPVYESMNDTGTDTRINEGDGMRRNSQEGSASYAELGERIWRGEEGAGPTPDLIEFESSEDARGAVGIGSAEHPMMSDDVGAVRISRRQPEQSVVGGLPGGYVAYLDGLKQSMNGSHSEVPLGEARKFVALRDEIHMLTELGRLCRDDSKKMVEVKARLAAIRKQLH